MVPIDLYPEFGIHAVWDSKPIQHFVTKLPKELITGSIRCADGSTRCSLRYLEVVNQGGYGTIQRVERTDSSGVRSRAIVCKKPIHDAQASDIAYEAILQHLSYKAVTEAGLLGTIPKVYDIYRFGDEQRFTMEYIDGCSALEAIYTSPDPSATFLQILAQTCILLLILESKLNLDHRDLKLTNLWIRRRPVSYSLTSYRVEAPVQVVLLDFGFACIGNSKRISTVNLGYGVFPDLDPCPKDGRNLFQLLTSVASLPAIYDRFVPALKEDMRSLLNGYIDLARRFQDPAGNWSLAILGDPAFSYPPLHPGAVLHHLAQRWPAIVSHGGSREERLGHNSHTY